MIEIKDGQVFINGVPTTDPTFIGCALLDLAEITKDTDKKLDIIDLLINEKEPE